jgi:hypothetical protein
VKGDSEKHQVLAEAKAMIVRDCLIENFKLDDQRIKTMAFAKLPEPRANGKVEILSFQLNELGVIDKEMTSAPYFFRYHSKTSGSSASNARSFGIKGMRDFGDDVRRFRG